MHEISIFQTPLPHHLVHSPTGLFLNGHQQSIWTPFPPLYKNKHTCTCSMYAICVSGTKLCNNKLKNPALGGEPGTVQVIRKASAI